MERYPFHEPQPKGSRDQVIEEHEEDEDYDYWLETEEPYDPEEDDD